MAEITLNEVYNKTLDINNNVKELSGKFDGHLKDHIEYAIKGTINETKIGSLEKSTDKTNRLFWSLVIGLIIVFAGLIANYTKPINDNKNEIKRLIEKLEYKIRENAK